MSVFETEVCGRCGGTGNYSYNQMHGTRCFGCAGAKVRLTKRGAVARAHYLELCTVPVSELVVGDCVPFGGVTNGGDAYTRKGIIQEIERKTQKGSINGVPYEKEVIVYWRTVNGRREGSSHWADSKVRKYWPKEINEAKIAEALAFQATLSKSGKPLKR